MEVLLVFAGIVLVIVGLFCRKPSSVETWSVKWGLLQGCTTMGKILAIGGAATVAMGIRLLMVS